MASPTWITKAEDIRSVEAEDFQRLCFQLLDFEVSYRHVQGRVGGPPEKYHGDKGMDLSVEIIEPPRYKKSDFSHALTEDSVAITCIACNSGEKIDIESLRLKSDFLVRLAKKYLGNWANEEVPK